MKTLIRIIITSVIIGFIVWLRLIRERFPTDIYPMIMNLNSNTILIFFIVAILNLLGFIFALKYIIFGNRQNKLIIKILQIPIINKIIQINNLIVNILKELYDDLSDRYDFFTNRLILSSSYIAAYFNYPYIL